MVILVSGGSGSGKSAYAESVIMNFSNQQNRYYLATMKAYDEEGQKRIERHRASRAGKGFETIEKPMDIGKAADWMEDGAAVLVECMSNLVANEMFSEYPSPTSEYVEQSIRTGIEKLIAKTRLLVIVTNNVFEDGVIYDDSTTEYIRVLGRLNQQLAAYADQVIEVTAGIPSIIKKNKDTCRNEQDTCRGKYKMELYLGGNNQGKRNYVQKLLTDETYCMFDGENLAAEMNALKQQIDNHSVDDSQVVVIDHLHGWIRRCMEQEADMDQMMHVLLNCSERVILICDEVGNGIVPMDAFEREYRERVGRVQCELAEKAERVERIICGISQRLK